jgi:ATP-dependent helicase/nuclease subunit A
MTNDPGGSLPAGSTRVFGRTLVLASAGSGKTYQLSSRLIGLLAAGAPAESVLASTFTRKAAGEILERVLLRLARASLGEDDARELADSLPGDLPADRRTSEAFRRLLLDAVRDLHRLQVHTLDAFMHRAVRAFALELGLPANWEVGEDPRSTALRSRAVEEVLRDDDRGALVELVRLVHLGGANRAVHGALLDLVDGFHGLYRELDPAVDAPWGFAGGWPSLPESRWDEHADRVGRAGAIQVEAHGTDHNWTVSLERIEAALRARDPAKLLDQTLWKNAFEKDPPAYSRKPIHGDLIAAFDDLARELPALVGPAWQRRMEALGRFLPRYDARIGALRRAHGRFGFDDLVHALTAAGALGRADELYYRLDGRIRHVLLDEFQDTSSAQWSALAPLVEELLSGYEHERAFLVVADPKQSIYGWRGGEPRLLEGIRERHRLEVETLERSWRSSPVVLDFVNRVFEGLPGNPLLDGPGDAEVAAAWMEAFRPHVAQHGELPGRVEVVTGPDGENTGARGDALVRFTADRVRELHEAAPGITIGILTRTNRTAARLMAELRERGVEASEEGGVPVVDSAPVVAILGLLSAADHPGDGVGAYLAARSPLGPWLGLERSGDPAAVERVARRLRARLLSKGYGHVVSRLADRMRPGAADRDLRRLDQLVELAFEWKPTLRPRDFVRQVEAARREDVAASAVRIMTIHRSKGLEFDAVVLPELDTPLGGSGRLKPAVPWRAEPTGPVSRILPGMPGALAALFPELRPALSQAHEAELRDAFSLLYVAITRARQGVHIFLQPDGKNPSRARTAARLVRAAPGLERGEGFHPEAFEGKGRLLAGAVVYESGDPLWYRAREGAEERSGAIAGAFPRVPPGRVALATSPRRRLLPRRTPSELEGGPRQPLADLLRTPPQGALERGTLVHAWLEEFEWLDQVPSVEALVESGRRRAPGFAGLEDLARRFRSWIEAPEVRRTLDRSAWPEGTVVLRELPFVVRDRDGILQGVADRVLRVPGASPRLVVVDWKTDAVGPGDTAAFEARVDRYRPQMEAYLGALAPLEPVRPESVEGLLVFLEAGRAVPVSPVPAARGQERDREGGESPRG